MKKIYNIPATEEILVASDMIMEQMLQGSDMQAGQGVDAPSRSMVPGYDVKVL